LAGTGLFIRGAFHPVPEDGVRPLADGRPAETLVLIGNAGPALWRAVRRDNAALAGEHPLDRWVDAHLDRVAAEVGAEVVYATRQPWPPIQRWALKAGGVFRSPIGILVHPEYGLWHVYRGALLFAERLEIPSLPQGARGNPCDSCADKPCLTRCPAGAFSEAGFDALACVGHVESRKGKACAAGGCLARRACPVGPAFAYDRDEGAYHMAAVVGAVRRMEARGEAPWKKPAVPRTDAD
jgi:hypothetical protein